MAYTDTTTLKRYLGISSTNDDTLLGECIARAQALIDDYTNRTFEAAADTTRTFDAVEDVVSMTLYFDDDLCQITSVTNGDGVVVAASEYTTQPRNETPWYALRLLASSGKSWTYEDDHEDAIAVVGRWAWSVTAPAAIVQATIRLAAYLYHQKDNAQELDRTVVTGGTVLLPGDLPRDLAQMLDYYRRLA